jgi:hypothetical protein
LVENQTENQTSAELKRQSGDKAFCQTQASGGKFMDALLVSRLGMPW